MLLQCQKGNKLTAAEQKAIDYINNNADEIIDLTIIDIAEHASVSASTVSRAIRKCGISKLTDIRYKIAEGNFIPSSMLQNAYSECTNVMRMIDIDAVTKVVEHIRMAKRIHILAKGMSYLVAKEFEFRLRYHGCQAMCYRDEVLRSFNKITNPDDLVLFFSVKGNDDALLRAAAFAKMQGLTVITCTGDESSALATLSDIVVACSWQKITLNKAKKCQTFSRLGLQLIAQTIVECLD